MGMIVVLVVLRICLDLMPTIHSVMEDRFFQIHLFVRLFRLFKSLVADCRGNFVLSSTDSSDENESSSIFPQHKRSTSLESSYGKVKICLQMTLSAVQNIGSFCTWITTGEYER